MKTYPVRVLLANDLHGVPIILATDSEIVAGDCEAVSTSAEDVGIVGKDDIGSGLWLFEGTARMGRGTFEEPPEMHYRGSCRQVKPEEMADLFAISPPEEKDPPCVRMLTTVRSDLPFPPFLIAHEGEIYPAETNQHGAVSVRIGEELLGVKPGEYESITAS